jgi:hypothetical protein
MDFKTRFQGKTSHITKDGGIDNAIAVTKAPINKAEVSTYSSTNAYPQTGQLIKYGPNNGASNGFIQSNGYQSKYSNA